MIRIQRILYPTDFSSYSNQAYFHAIALAQAHQATLTILFVYHPELTPVPASAGQVDPHAYWKKQLEQIRPVDLNITVNHILLDGDPATQIVRCAREGTMNLIVMGTHGSTGKETTTMGSVAGRVLRDADCSVLVVKMPRSAASCAG